MRQYDLPALMNSVTAESVAEYIGMEIQSRGKRKLILCPNKNHDDHHFGSCYLTPQGYACYACGARGGIIDMVSGVLQISKQEAVDIIAESTGEPELFTLSGKEKSNKRKQRIVTVLPDGKLKLIGLAPAQSEVRVYTRGYYAYEDRVLSKGETEEWFPGDEQHEDYVVISKLVDRFPLKTLAREEPAVYRKLICAKAEEAIDQYNSMCALIQNTSVSQDFKNIMVQAIQSIIAEIEEILIDHGGQIKKKKHRFGTLQSGTI